MRCAEASSICARSWDRIGGDPSAGLIESGRGQFAMMTLCEITYANIDNLGEY